MKKRTWLFTYLLLLASVALGQDTFRSEIVKSTLHFQVKGNRLIRTDTVVLQINERMGDNDAMLGFPYSKGDKIDVLYARIEDLSGNIIRKLKKTEIKDQSYISEISLYEDDFIKHFEMKHNTYPYRVSYAVRTTQSKFLQIYSLDLLYQRKPVREATVIVESSLDRPIKYKLKNIGEPEITTREDMSCHVWKYSYMPIKGWNINTDFNQTDAPQLKILPVSFDYGKKGSWESWESFGNWIFRLNTGLDMLSATEKTRIDEALTGITGDREKVKAIYRYLQQNIRYINVKIDVGGFQAYPAQYVADHKYGDCKALTNYMLAVLKYIGIPSYYTLVYADEDVSDIDPDFPSQEFNHVILTVPLANDTVFLECTSKSLPFGYIHSGIQGRKALLVKENGSHLITIPQMCSAGVLCSRKITIQNSQLEIESIQRGERFEESVSMLSGVNKNALDKYLRNSIFPSGTYSLNDYEIDKIHDDSAQVCIRALLRMENTYRKYGNSVILASFPISLPHYETPEKRTFGLQLNYPLYREDTVIYKIFEGEISKLPDAVEINTPFGNYRVRFAVEENRLIIQKSLLILSGRYTLNEYQAFYDFISRVKNNENKNIYIEVL